MNEEIHLTIPRPTIPFFKEKYHNMVLFIYIKQWEVHGLRFEARGTASPLLSDFFKNITLELKELKEMCLVMMRERDTLNIIHKNLNS